MRAESLFLSEGTAVLLVKIATDDSVTALGKAYVCSGGHLTAPASLFDSADRLAFIPIWEADGSVPIAPAANECIGLSLTHYDAANDVAQMKIGA